MSTKVENASVLNEKTVIKKAAVIGSGVMGAGIAAHLANVGIPVLLLDIVPQELTKEEATKGLTLNDKQVRNRLAEGAKKKLLKQKPAPLTAKQNLNLITAGNLEDDLQHLADADWIIEVVVERLDIKQKVFAQIDHVRKQGSIVSSNTSGLPITDIAEGRSEDFKRHFLGTHFFNPPRYLQLLEIIPTKDTDNNVIQFMKAFAENTLGKGVVEAKDTPNFIANRIGTYGLLVTVQEMIKGGYSVGEVDSITGPIIGRPKSATFRTLDVVGLDTFIHVSNNIFEKLAGEEKEMFCIPAFMNDMLEKGWLGSKSGQGFFLKQGKEILELNIETMEYEQRKKLKTAATEMCKQLKTVEEKMKTLIYANDRAGTFLWHTLKSVLLYTAELYKDIANDIVAIDQALKWGFGWEHGPFEIWDVIGVEKSVAIMKNEGAIIPEWIETMLANGYTSFYKQENGQKLFYDEGTYHTLQYNPKTIYLSQQKQEKGVIKQNTGASLIDLGDGVACLEFHAKNNAIGPDIVQMINFAIDEVAENYAGLVIGNQGKNFCVGANLAMILMEAQEGNFPEIDLTVRQFQQAMMRIKYSEKPIVAAPFAMTLGGGAEISLPTSQIQAASETYIGLVEVGVGLIPGGGGNKELYIRQLNGLPKGVDFDLEKITNRVFEMIATAKVSTSAHEARENGFLSGTDRVSFNKDHLIYDAKQAALALATNGYKAPNREKIPVVGESGYAAMVMGAQTMMYSGYISEHDLKIAKKLATVLSGGKLAKGTMVDEQYLLDLEREAFLSLVGEPKTMQRMQHMLVKGKPLRN